jgi:hypothetical protein
MKRARWLSEETGRPDDHPKAAALSAFASPCPQDERIEPFARDSTAELLGLLGWDKPRLHTASLVVDPDRVAVILVCRVRLQRKARAGSEVVRLDRLEPVAGARDLHDVYAMGEGFVIPGKP